MRSAAMRVGELAKRTGVSVRTLHHYDAIGLLSPSCRSEAGHRLYTGDDIARLQQIKSLQQLGFSLTETRECLARRDFSPLRVIELHLAHVRERIALERRLCARLEAIARGLRSAEAVSVEEFLHTVEATSMVGKYYTPEQLAWLKERRERVGEERIREVEAEWPQLIAQVRDAMDAGLDPADARVQQLARRWGELVNEFTGGDPGIEKSLRTMYEREAPQDIHPSLDPRMREYGAYIGKAMAVAKQSE